MDPMSERDDQYNRSEKGLNRHERFRLRNMPHLNAYGRHWRRRRKREDLLREKTWKTTQPARKAEIKTELAKLNRLDAEYLTYVKNRAAARAAAKAKHE